MRIGSDVRVVSASEMIIGRFYEDKRSEIEYIVRTAGASGLDLMPSEAVILWEKYSERFYRVSWYVPDSDWRFSVRQFVDWVKNDCPCADPLELEVLGKVSQVTVKSNPLVENGLGVFYSIESDDGRSFDVRCDESLDEARALINHRAFGRVYIDI